ncbi:major urinary protein 20 isoform X1 [Mesocricetus auratus]|uniref:Major urinary protein 20 isoform X1 n=1 Tax=Mesocricetus auratus TaxID=10036 RepID=A0A0H4SQI0_MESAU|nr:major urinary protein 20 isoform X1 [Mesocricetus auratus]XP_040593614.1 major urinary protein 20 isoform X1 [Mesocricetus auratus]AKP95981.1 major urinary protein-like lipocalin 2 precursor [Mesocricetus auratus]ARG42047.1 major urinary protein-like lipocalin 2 precursor [Mesocricetus auratus]
MKLLLLLLVLGLELTLVCVHAEEKTSLTGKNFNPEKIVGKWHSILLASDKREMIEEYGSMRMFMEYIRLFKNSSLAVKFHTIANEECTELYLVCDKTEKGGVYDAKYDGYNRFTILDTDYNDYIITHLRNIKNGETFQLMKLCGRKPKLSSNIKKKFGDLCQKHGIVKENIIDLTEADHCLKTQVEIVA